MDAGTPQVGHAGRSGQQHHRAEHPAEQPYALRDPFGAAGDDVLDERQGYRAEFGAQRDSFGQILAAAHAAGGDDRSGQARLAAHGGQHAGGGVAPVGQLARSFGVVAVEALRLYQHPVGAARAGDVDVIGAGVDQPQRGGGRDAEPGLLDDHRQRTTVTERRDRRLQTAEVAVAAGLEQFLARIEVKGDSLYPQAVEGVDDPLVIDIAELRGGQVGDYRHVRGLRLDREVIERRRVLQADPHRSQADGDPARLRGGGELAVGVAALARAAGHAGDHQRQRQFGAQERGGGVDVVQVELRQRLVLEPHQIEAGPDRARDSLFRAGDAGVEVVLLALLNR